MRDNSDLRRNKRRKLESKVINCQLRIIPTMSLKASTHCTQPKETSVENTTKITIYELPPNQKSSIQEDPHIVKKEKIIQMNSEPERIWSMKTLTYRPTFKINMIVLWTQNSLARTSRNSSSTNFSFRFAVVRCSTVTL